MIQYPRRFTSASMQNQYDPARSGGMEGLGPITGAIWNSDLWHDYSSQPNETLSLEVLPPLKSWIFLVNLSAASIRSRYLAPARFFGKAFKMASRSVSIALTTGNMIP